MDKTSLIYQMMQFMAEANSHFNSGFAEEVHYKDEASVDRQTIMHNWFLPPEVQYPQGHRTEIGFWPVSNDERSNQEAVHVREFGKRPAEISSAGVFIPQTLEDSWAYFTKKYGEPQKKYTAYLTPSGRSFWVLPQGDGEMSFGLKMHVTSNQYPDAILKKHLDVRMIENTITTSGELKNNSDAASEDYGFFLEFKNDQNEKLELGYVYRHFKWEQVKPQEGDLLLPMSTLLSPTFWRATEVLKQIGLPIKGEADIREWLSDQLAPHFAKQIIEALFNSGIHFESHQQNLTALIRRGQIEQILYHDLQDCLYDPVTLFLLKSKKSAGIDETAFKTRQYLALPGEILTPDTNEKLFVNLSDWWRRWLRIFGRYDRILNVLQGDNPYEKIIFENKIKTHVVEAAEKYKIMIPNSGRELDLFALLAGLQFSFQQKLLKEFLQNNLNSFQPAETMKFLSGGVCIATSRAPWTEKQLIQWLEQNAESSLYVKKIGRHDIYLAVSKFEAHLYYHEPAK